MLTTFPNYLNHTNKRFLVFIIVFLILIAFSFRAYNISTNQIIDTGAYVEVPNSVYSKIKGISPLPSKDQQNQLIGVRINFKAQDKGTLDKFIQSQADPNSPNYRNYQIPEQLLDKTTIPEAIYNKTISYYTQQGLTILDKTQLRSMLLLTGTRQKVENAFRVKINNYFIDGAIYCHANDKNPLMPADIAQFVQSIEMNSCGCSGSHGTAYPITCN